MGFIDEEWFYKEKTELDPKAQKEADYTCDKLRMKFIKDWALDRNVDAYKTDAERNWAFVVRREYRYAVTFRSIFDGMFVANLVQISRIFSRKRIVFWPLIPIWPLVYKYQTTVRFSQHNRRMFQMLNVGTEFELGAERNRVLEECNRIAHRADF